MEQRLRLVGGTPDREEKRAVQRRPLAVPGQLVWKDAAGTTRMASVVTRDVSDTGVSLAEARGPAIPMYRIVYFQVDRSARHRPDLPAILRKPTVLSAVFRVGSCNPHTGAPTEYALRLLVEPERRVAASVESERRLRAQVQAPAWQPASGEMTA